MKGFVKPVALLVATSFLFSCNPGKNKSDETKVVINATDKMSSQELIDSAEQIVTPYSFMLAYKLSNMALQKDPENTKALFYNKLLKRFEAFRGVYSRIKPALTPEQQVKLQKQIDSFPNSALKDFLTEPGPDIKTVEDLQGLIGQYFSAVAEFRQFLKDKENSEMQIYLNPLIFAQEIHKELANTCKVDNQGENSIQIECDASNVAVKKLNVADFVALRQAAAGEMIWGMELNSYSLEGIREFSKVDSTKLTYKQQLDLIFQNEKFGKLRSDNLLPKLLAIGSDLGAAVNWAVKYKSTICPSGYPTKLNRPNYLFREGICIENSSELSKALVLLDSALKGAVPVDLPDNAGSARIDYFAWSRNPVADLRSLMPEFDSTGNVITTFKDNSLGGIFVDNNADKILLKH